MGRPTQKSSPITTLILCLAPAISLMVVVLVAKDWKTRFLHSGGLVAKQCKPTHRAGGFVRDTMTLAKMSAITSWSKGVMKYGLDYNFWTNAEKKLLRCKKIKNTRLINCIAWAAPCRNVFEDNPEVQTAKKI